MKLFFLTGGGSVHSKKWVKYFIEKGHNVFWLSLGIEAKDIANGVKFFFAKKIAIKPLRPLYYISFLQRKLGETNPDILHVHQVWIDGIIGALSGYHPLIITPWGSDVLMGPKSWTKKPLIKFALRKADLITCDGENTRMAVINLGVNPEKIKIIRFGVDVEKFKPDSKNEHLKSILKIADGPVVISLRSLNPIYDLSTLIKAIPSVLSKISNVKFIIAGEGVQKDELAVLSKSLGVYDSIIFTGNIPVGEIPKYLNLADVYVSTALSDSGIASSTAEAMSCGLPVIVTDTGDNQKWVINEENGFIVPIKNPKILAEKVIDLLEDEKLRKKIGRNNRAVIENKNNYYKEMEKMENIYNELRGAYER